MSAEVKLGGAFFGIFASPYVRGFYNEQRLARNKQAFRTLAYGYLNYQHAAEPHALLDFSREQDGMVRKESPNLAIPSLTYDIYSLTGQGIAAMYRPTRTDYGIIHDPATESLTLGASIGGDAAPVLSHAGINLGVNYGVSKSGPWATSRNEIGSNFAFQALRPNDPYEPTYFKVHGEPVALPLDALAGIGGDAAVQVALESGDQPRALNRLQNKARGSFPAPAAHEVNRQRDARAEMITTLTNAQLLRGNEEVSALFKIKVFEGTNNRETAYSRTWPAHHPAGLTAVNPNGLRYVYALPAYNTRQDEVQFSCEKPTNASLVRNDDNGTGDPVYDKGDKYLNRTKLPPFAHSYLLTAIVGPDYVDVDNDGVTPDDLGYWVKFTYRRVASAGDPYKWRAPFSQSLYNEGLKTDHRDDRGSYAYGEKEIWYLARAETKSHIAIFTTQERKDTDGGDGDGQGAASELQNTNLTGKKLLALTEVRLVTRLAESVPLKVAKFEYDYSLCRGVPNASAGKGKMTLKKVWFEYGTSRRGRLNPYTFTYHPHNPNYDMNAVDRWGSYKPYPAGDPNYNKEFPYAEQDPTKKAGIDANAAAWSLTEIGLPSGSKILVDYESDDYAYVQHRSVMQMVDPYSSSKGPLSSRFLLRQNDLKVRFLLEKPLPASFTGNQREEVLKYLDQDRKQLFFKIKINLGRPGENFREFISGYADIDLTAPMGLEEDDKGVYRYGYFYLARDAGYDNYHPLSLRAWQHLRVNQPNLVRIGNELKASEDSGARLSDILSMVTLLPTVVNTFKGFNRNCFERGWGREVETDQSWIRLHSPDQIKYGGGLRVKQITLKDQWKNTDKGRLNEEGVYGQTYDYTIEENGRTISSGVASYEPFQGGEENALRYAKKFVQTVPLASANQLFFEYPVNEGYFPGPGVGYRRVTVKSLASAALAGEPTKNTTLSDGTATRPPSAPPG